MAEPTALALVCEGKDDLEALRPLLERSGAKPSGATSAGPSVAPRRGPRHYRTPRGTLIVQASDGKSGLASLAADLSTGTSSLRPEAVLVVFDPNGDPANTEFRFFKDAWKATGRQQLAGPLRNVGGGCYESRVRNRTIRFIPAPWRSTGAPRHPFDALPDEQCLERVLIDGIVQVGCTAAGMLAWAEQATADLRKLVEDHGHKRAFRIWNAALFPDSESFVARLLEAPTTRDACLAALCTTKACEAIVEALGPVPARDR